MENLENEALRPEPENIAEEPRNEAEQPAEPGEITAQEEQEAPVQEEIPQPGETPAQEEIPAAPQNPTPVQEPIPAVPQNPVPPQPAPNRGPYVWQPPQHFAQQYQYEQAQAYRANAGRMASPYGASPYVMNPGPQPGGYVPPVPPYEAPRQSYVPPAPPVPPTPPAAQEPPVPEKKKKSGMGRRILAAVLVIALVAAGCLATAGAVNSHWESRTAQMTQSFDQKLSDLQSQLDAYSNESTGESVSGSPSATAGGLTPAQVFAQNKQSVVLIYNEITTSIYGQTQTGTSTGSGFILTEDGYVATNYHVVEDTGILTVVTWDGMEYDATLVGFDENNDVAVLKMEGEGFQAVTLGSSDDLIVGDQVVAIGNPLGELTSTLTVGYVSAKERDVTTDNATINMIQTDAAINSGNSGGPLFNMKGEVIGITTAKYSGSSSSGASIEGIGFAIPIDDVADMLDDLMTYGYVTGAYLGVSVYAVDEATSKMYNIPMGCRVDSVVEGSCAEKAGVLPSDIIIGLGEYTVEGFTDLSRALRQFEAGDTTTITVYRGGRELVLEITLDEKPRIVEVTPTVPDDGNMPEDGSYEEWFRYFFGDGNG